MFVGAVIDPVKRHREYRATIEMAKAHFSGLGVFDQKEVVGIVREGAFIGPIA